MDKTDRAAYNVLREHFASLCASGFDPSTAASELFAKKLINAALRDVTTRDISKNDKRKELVDGVMRCGRPGTFQTFLQILYKDDGYLAEGIRGERLDSRSACPPPPPLPQWKVLHGPLPHALLYVSPHSFLTFQHLQMRIKRRRVSIAILDG